MQADGAEGSKEIYSLQEALPCPMHAPPHTTEEMRLEAAVGRSGRSNNQSLPRQSYDPSRAYRPHGTAAFMGPALSSRPTSQQASRCDMSDACMRTGPHVSSRRSEMHAAAEESGIHRMSSR